MTMVMTMATTTAIITSAPRMNVGAFGDEYLLTCVMLKVRQLAGPVDSACESYILSWLPDVNWLGPCS